MTETYRTAGLTTTALIAFAANSIFCRFALGDQTIDAASFTTVRLASGALTLACIALLTGRGSPLRQGNWTSASMLFLYAVTFSFAYISLSAGTGALILFGAVQITMIFSGLIAGERPRLLEWFGLLAALGGLVYLMLPGLSAPSPLGSALMTVAGIAWGVYSLRGRGIGDPIANTTGNFVRAAPLALVVSLIALSNYSLSPKGALLAVLSGALASGLGYVIWYAALRNLTATRAATVQLAVPVIAAAAGVFFLAEAVTLRLTLSSIAILGGVGLAISSHTNGTESNAK